MGAARGRAAGRARRAPGGTPARADVTTRPPARQATPFHTPRLAPDDVLALQRSAGNASTAGLVTVAQRQPAPTPRRAIRKDRPIDVVEAIVHVMSNRGLSGDVGPRGENVSSPRYAPEVAGTVLEQEHKTLLWVWYLIAVGDEVTRGDRAKIAEAHQKTAALFARAKADRAMRARAAALEARYNAGLEELTQRAAREQVDEMIEAGVRVAERPGQGFAGEDDRLRVGVEQAHKVLTEVATLSRRVLGSQSSPSQTDLANRRAQAQFDARLRVYLQQVFKHGEFPDVPELQVAQRAATMNFADGVTLLKGGLDGVNAILAVSDPKARAALLGERSNYFGRVAQGADINKVLWQFVSGTISFGGAGVYGVARIVGNTTLAEGVLDATVRGVANVAGILNLAGLVHGAAVLLDPDASTGAKAEAAVEVASSAIGLGGFASRWFPRLAWASRWSGPVAASLAINLAQFKHLAKLQYKAQVGLNRLDWASCYRTLDAGARAVLRSQRLLAATSAILATETDPRRKTALQQYADAFRWDLVAMQLKPFLDRHLAGTSRDQDVFSCGIELSRRFAPVRAMLGTAGDSDAAALAAGAAFLLTVDKAFTDWDKIVMSKDA